MIGGTAECGGGDDRSVTVGVAQIAGSVSGAQPALHLTASAQGDSPVPNRDQFPQLLNMAAWINASRRAAAPVDHYRDVRRAG
jgi:hypothetical protein